MSTYTIPAPADEDRQSVMEARAHVALPIVRSIANALAHVDDIAHGYSR